MIRDALDILNPRKQFTATATYWDDRPDSVQDGGGKQFSFEYINPYSRTFKVAFGAMQVLHEGETAIRTNDDVGMRIGGFIMLQDGRLYNVLEVATDFQTANKQALRFLGVPLGTQYVVRMVSVQNDWNAR